jgi:hypothetical protein
MQTVVGLYDRFEDAQRAVQALHNEGFRNEDISLIASDREGRYSRELEGRRTDVTTDTDVADGAAAGAGIGAVLGGLGGLLVGLGALAIPGIGPVIAAGPLISTLAGAGIGAATGGLIGALVDLGIPEEHAHVYSEGVTQGGTLVVVHADANRADRALSILNRFNPVDIDERNRTRGTNPQGWSDYNTGAGAGTVHRDPAYDRDQTNVPVTGGMVDDDLTTRDRDFNQSDVGYTQHDVTRDQGTTSGFGDRDFDRDRQDLGDLGQQGYDRTSGLTDHDYDARMQNDPMYGDSSVHDTPVHDSSGIPVTGTDYGTTRRDDDLIDDDLILDDDDLMDDDDTMHDDDLRDRI